MAINLSVYRGMLGFSHSRPGKKTQLTVLFPADFWRG